MIVLQGQKRMTSVKQRPKAYGNTVNVLGFRASMKSPRYQNSTVVEIPSRTYIVFLYNAELHT